jgi:hypothetical protein
MCRIMWLTFSLAKFTQVLVHLSQTIKHCTHGLMAAVGIINQGGCLLSKLAENVLQLDTSTVE